MGFLYNGFSPNSKSFGRMPNNPYTPQPITTGAHELGFLRQARQQASGGSRVGDAVLGYNPQYQNPNYKSPYQLPVLAANPSLFGNSPAPRQVFGDMNTQAQPVFQGNQEPAFQNQVNSVMPESWLQQIVAQYSQNNLQPLEQPQYASPYGPPAKKGPAKAHRQPSLSEALGGIARYGGNNMLGGF